MPASRPPHVTQFITAHLAAARDVRQRYHVPVSVTLAQSALETDWGQQVKACAYFGVKGTCGTAGGATFGTHECDAAGPHDVHDTFRAFTCFAEAADDYGRLLATLPRYRPAFARLPDVLGFVDAVAAAGYATDPEYAGKVRATIVSERLTEFDGP